MSKVEQPIRLNVYTIRGDIFAVLNMRTLRAGAPRECGSMQSINDYGSKDLSVQVLERIKHRFPLCRALRLHILRNFGLCPCVDFVLPPQCNKVCFF